MLLVNETIKLKSNALHHPFTLNPGTISLTQNTMKILMKIKNKPNVKTVIGMVNATSMGFTKVLIRPSTTATIMAVSVLSTLTPRNKYDAIKTATEVKMALVINFIIDCTNINLYYSKTTRTHCVFSCFFRIINPKTYLNKNPILKIADHIPLKHSLLPFNPYQPFFHI